MINTRALQALDLHRRGMTLKDIGKQFGVTKERARQLTVLGIRTERVTAEPMSWDALSARLRNALINDLCEPTPDGVVQHFKTRDWKRVPNFGAKCFAELNAWLVHYGKEPLA